MVMAGMLLFKFESSCLDQHPKEVSRGQTRPSQHFKFVEKPRGAQQNTNRPDAKKINPTMGFARWSEYVSEDSGEIEIPDSDYKSISISLSREESSSMTDPGNSKQALQTSDRLQEKVEEVAAANKKEEVKEKKEDPPAAGSSYAKSYSKILKDVRNSNTSPFFVPNISEVKPRDIVNTRNSQQFLLDLLNQGQEKWEEQPPKVIKEQESDPLPSKQQQQPNGRKSISISYKELQKRKSGRQSFKQDSDPLPKPEVQPTGRQKRVTINDRGKIKYPNDSISGDISYILPEEFREVEEKGPDHYKRKLVIEEEAEDDDKPVVASKPAEEPMDVIKENQKEQEKEEVKADVVKEKSKGRNKKGNAQKAERAERAEKAEKAQNKAKMKKQEQKLKDIAKKAPVPRVTDNRKSKIVRISDRQPSRDHNSGRSTSNKSNTASTQPKKKVVEKRPETQNPSKKGTAAEQERKRRKFKKQEETQVQIVEIINLSPAKNNGRPRRARQKPKKFWQNKKTLIGRTGSYQSLSKEQVLEILGFHSISDIRANPPDCSPIDIRITLLLSNRKKYYSSGLDLAAMAEFGIDFDELCIQLYRPKETTHIVAMKNDTQVMDLMDDVIISAGQTFSFENTSTAKAYRIALLLYKRKQEVEEQEQ